MLAKSLLLTENQNIEVAYFDSSNIKKSYFDYTTNQLSIVFGNGKVYQYAVNETEYLIFKQHESQGKYFNSSIKQLPYTLLDKIELMEDIQKEIEEINKSEAHNFFLLLKEKMKDYLLLEEYDNDKTDDIIKTIHFLKHCIK